MGKFRIVLDENGFHLNLTPKSSQLFNPLFTNIIELNEHHKDREIYNIFYDIENGNWENLFGPGFQEEKNPKQNSAIEALRVLYASKNGLPFIADPGGSVARVAQNMGWGIEVIPGPSSIVTSLGYLAQEFHGFIYKGFLPRKNEERLRKLKEWGREARNDPPIVFMETPYRFPKLTNELIQSLDRDQKILWGYELTSKDQKIWSGRVSQLKNNFPHGFPKGNACLILSGRAP